jgi:DNA-binding winged helix-turn-helix (wHTH) protein
MNVERQVGARRIGAWKFAPATGELRQGAERRRLEPRAARVLELLCEAEGEVVAQDELIRRVWAGRSLSENSVAVVIGQLRRALGDDAREPRLIETIPKRGYRLVQGGDVAGERHAARRLWIGLQVAALIAGTFAALALRPALAPEVAVADVANQTGDPAYDPLARATSELMVADLGERGFAVRRHGPADLRMAAKLVMWDGLPYLGVTATDGAGVVRWSAMIKATPGAVPGGLAARLDEFKRTVERG